MSGPGYNLPNVLWTMYFYKGYGRHGTYWHNNFGQLMSHGSVNMRDEDAKWLFDWAPRGTSVLVLP
jgi:lipoprotein-anchoring transpeptidase ErfK/SrfK